MADNDQLLKQIGNLIDTKLDEKLEPIHQRLGNLEQGQAQTNATVEQNKTILEAVAAGQKELQETVAMKADVLTVGVKVDKLRKRIEGIEEHTGSPNPHKN